jgi:hypothetical protein
MYLKQDTSRLKYVLTLEMRLFEEKRSCCRPDHGLHIQAGLILHQGYVPEKYHAC